MEVIGKLMLSIAIIIGVAFLLAFPTMWLWNWLMTDLFSLHRIDLQQAIGLNCLSGILFKSSNSK